MLQKLLENQLYIKAEKCELFLFLSWVQSSPPIRFKWTPLRSVWWLIGRHLIVAKKARQFLGFANFYRKFIQNFSSVASPLHALTSSKTPFQWSPHAEKAFQSLNGKIHHSTSHGSRSPMAVCGGGGRFK